jgi:hypothetical protein
VKTFRAGPLFVYEWGEHDAPALLYWDGLGGTGLHANELGPLLAEEQARAARDRARPARTRPLAGAGGGRAVAVSAPSDGGHAALGARRRASRVPGLLLGPRVGRWFAARFPEQITALALVEGGHHRSLPPTALRAAIAEARAEREDETFDSWEAYLAYERESLRRWTPELEEAHRAVMVEEAGRVAPVLSAEALGAINQGSRLEPVAEAYPALAAAGLPVLLVVSSELAPDSVERFRTALPEARVESIPDSIHDLVSFAPDKVAQLVGTFAASQYK